MEGHNNINNNNNENNKYSQLFFYLRENVSLNWTEFLRLEWMETFMDFNPVNLLLCRGQIGNSSLV